MARGTLSVHAVLLAACAAVLLLAAPAVAWKALDNEEPGAVFTAAARRLLQNTTSIGGAEPNNPGLHQFFGGAAVALGGLSASLFAGAVAWGAFCPVP